MIENDEERLQFIYDNAINYLNKLLDNNTKSIDFFKCLISYLSHLISLNTCS